MNIYLLIIIFQTLNKKYYIILLDLLNKIKNKYKIK